MAMIVTENAFTGKEQAVEKIKAANLWVLEYELEATNGMPHWHDYYVEAYILDGTFTFRDDTTGVEYICGEGARLIFPPRTVHSELAGRVQAVIGLSIDPATLPEDLDLSPAELKQGS